MNDPMADEKSRIEGIANRIGDKLKKYGLGVSFISVWGTPTEVAVTQAYVFDGPVTPEDEIGVRRWFDMTMTGGLDPVGVAVGTATLVKRLRGTFTIVWLDKRAVFDFESSVPEKDTLIAFIVEQTGVTSMAELEASAVVGEVFGEDDETDDAAVDSIIADMGDVCEQCSHKEECKGSTPPGKLN